MKKVIAIILAAEVCLLSCRNRVKPESSFTNHIMLEEPENLPDTSPHSGENTTTRLPIIDTMTINGEPYALCRQTLTSLEAVRNLTLPPDSIYNMERTSHAYAYFRPEKNIIYTSEVRKIELFYNMIAVLNREIHSYELNGREFSAKELSTKQDTLDIIAGNIYRPKDSFISSVIKSSRAAIAASNFLRKCAEYDGDDTENSEFNTAFTQYKATITQYQYMPTDKECDDFKNNFWDWYDKNRYIEGIDKLIKVSCSKKGVSISENQDIHFRNVILAEKDIDRRAILALEYSKFNAAEGSLLLGEIIESGIYTRYILEVWIAWRAYTQIEFISPSSFAVIANNYYDRLRVKCMNTIIRHMQSPKADRYDKLLLCNLIACEVVHRQGSLFGNSAFATAANLQSEMFVDPRIK